MRLRRTIKYLVILFAIAAEIIEGQVLHPMVIAHTKDPADTLWDDIVMGTSFGIIFFVILTLFDNTKERERRRERILEEMNGHIRNALEALERLPDYRSTPEHVRNAISRTVWTVQCVLPEVLGVIQYGLTEHANMRRECVMDAVRRADLAVREVLPEALQVIESTLTENGDEARECVRDAIRRIEVTLKTLSLRAQAAQLNTRLDIHKY